MIDYRKILVAYIRHVGKAEGSTFLSERHVDRTGVLEHLMEEEWNELLRCDEESGGPVPADGEKPQ